MNVLARAVLRAAEIRENSFDHVAAACTCAGELTQFYRKTHSTAIAQACAEFGLFGDDMVIVMLLYHHNNGSPNWARNKLTQIKERHHGHTNQPRNTNKRRTI